MKKILFIVGSRRKDSFNRQLAKLTEKLIQDQAEVSYLDYSSIPLMDQDIEYPAPEEIERVRKQCLSADAIWIFTPEYNHSYPGALKNLIDWLSRPLYKGAARSENALNGKPFTISTAAGASGGLNAETGDVSPTATTLADNRANRINRNLSKLKIPLNTTGLNMGADASSGGMGVGLNIA